MESVVLLRAPHHSKEIFSLTFGFSMTNSRKEKQIEHLYGFRRCLIDFNDKD